MKLRDDYAGSADAAAPGVLMVLDGKFPTRGGGGAENQVAGLARYFSSRGLPVRLIAVRRQYGNEALQEVIDGLPLVRLRHPPQRLVSTAVLLWKLAWWLVRERHTYAAIHAHIAGRMAAVACVLGRLLGKPVVVKYTGFTDIDAEAGNRSLELRLRNRLLRGATWIQVTSNRAAAAVVREGFDPAQVRLVPNSIDVVRFQPRPGQRAAAREAFGIDAGATVAVYCGRFDPVKGLDVLLEAWNEAFGASPDRQLVIAGRGWKPEIDAATEQAASRLACGARVRFVGPQKRVEELLAAADYAVLPSRSEGLSNSLLEFMASGLPVVGTRVSGTEDLIEPGVTGLLCEPGDAPGLAAALRQMDALGTAGRAALGARARGRVIDYAAVDRIGPQLAALYGLAHYTHAAGGREDASCAA